MSTATQELIANAHAKEKLVNAISQVKSTTGNTLRISTHISFDNFPCVINTGYYGTENTQVYLHSVAVNTEINCGPEYLEPAVTHWFQIYYRLVLRTGAMGSLPKNEITHRNTLEQMLGGTTVTQLERDNVKQLISQAKNLTNIMEAYN
jgi:hypothetical protein